MSHIIFGASKKIIKADHIVAVGKQSLAKVRAQEPHASGDQRSAISVVVFHEEF
jgi:hypothetical protein